MFVASEAHCAHKIEFVLTSSPKKLHLERIELISI